MRRQACVIGGWTEPRGSRPFFGALLLGVYDDEGRLHYIGHSGAGFTDAELGRVWTRLHGLRAGHDHKGARRGKSLVSPTGEQGSRR